MNYIVFGLILICCLARAIETNGYHIFDKRVTFEELAERFKNVLKIGSERLGIPVLDPFFTQQTHIKLNEEQRDLYALLMNVNVLGLSEFKVLDGDFQLSESDLNIKFNINLTWPLIIGNTTYSTVGDIDSYEFYGNGHLNLSAQNFTLETEITFTISEQDHFKVKNMELKLSLKKLHFYMTDLVVTRGSYNNKRIISNDIINKWISGIAPKWLEHEEVIDYFKLFAIKKIDAFLSTKTIGEILLFIL